MKILTFDKDEAWLRSKIPVKVFEEYQDKDIAEIRVIDFSGNGFCTDTVLKVIATNIKKPLTNLIDVNLQGCILLTDLGIKWLCEIIKGAEKLCQIYLDGCVKLTDASLVMLDKVTPHHCRIMMRGTYLTHIDVLSTKILHSDGCPFLRRSGAENREDKTGFLLIIPQNSVRQSLSHYIKTKAIIPKKDRYDTDIKIDDWNMSVLEIPLDSPLFDLAVTQPIQVIIPVDTSSAIEEMKQHVINTVTRVVTKEKYAPQYTGTTSIDSVETIPCDFIDGYMTTNCILEDDVLRCCSLEDSRRSKFVSTRRLTRSNNVFEIKVLEVNSSSQQGNIVVGMISDPEYASFIHKGDLNSDNSSVECETKISCDLKAGMTIRFEVTGDWISEYCLTSGSYSIKVDGETKNRPNEQKIYKLHPFVSVLGEAKIKIRNIYLAPQDVKRQLKEKKKWMTPFFAKNLLIDRDGILSYTPSGPKILGSFASMTPFTPTNDECTIKIINPGTTENIFFAIGQQEHKIEGDDFPNTEERVLFECKSGKLSKGKQVTEDGSLKAGDILKIKVNFEDLKKNTCTLEIYKNDAMVAKCPMIHKFSDGTSNLYFVMAVYSPKAKLQIENLNTQHTKVNPEKIMFGDACCVDVYDDGVMESNCCCRDPKSSGVGLFISKVPLSSKLMYFEMKILSIPVTIDTPEKDKEGTQTVYPCAIGLWHNQYLFQQSLGANAGSVSYTNYGTLFSEEGTAAATKLPTFGDGDIVGCGIEGGHDGEELQFDDNGELKPHTNLHVFFTKNGKKIGCTNMTYKTDGIYPSIMLSKYQRVRILNFYADGEKFWRIDKHLQSQRNEKKPEDLPSWNGCEFVVVGVGNKAAEDKINILQKEIDLKRDLPLLKDTSKHVHKLQKKVEKLDLQGQENFSNLCSVLERLQCLSENQQRLHFISIDMASPQILANLEKIVDSIQEKHMRHNPLSYELSSEVSVITKRILAKLQACKILDAKTTSFGFEDISNLRLQSILQYLQDKGMLVLVEIDFEKYAIDMQFITEVLPDILQLKSSQMKENLCTAIGQSSEIWKTADIVQHLTRSYKDKVELLLKLLREHFGLIKLPCFRIQQEDETYIYTTRMMVKSPPVSLNDFWTGGKGTRDDAVLMRCTYIFPNMVSGTVLSTITARVVKFGRVLILTDVGILMQIGAAQIAIVKGKSKSGKSSICVESTCYMPENTIDITNIITKSTVQDYAWNVLSLFTDVIDNVLRTKRIIPIIKRDVPDGMVNVSIGCKHKWTDEHEHPHVQSICTLCNNCVESGEDCDMNGIMGDYLRKCSCNPCVEGCDDCGICQRCVKDFWDKKSSLRPMPVTSISTRNLLQVPLDKVSYNEVEYIHLSGGSSCLFLKDENSGTSIQVYPGEAKVVEEKGIDLRHYCHDSRTHKDVVPGLTVRVKLTDPMGAVTHPEQQKKKDHKEKVQASRVIYHSSTCRELRISHETGLICYDTSSSGYPVGQFIGPNPFSATSRKFSFKIINLGTREEIGIGITPKTYQPNSMPGWRKSSFAYHADDGRIYQSQGMSMLGTGVFGKNGDIMECEIKFLREGATLYFRNNGKQVHTEVLPPAPPGGYYPCIGIRSFGGVVKLLEKYPWVPENTNEKFDKPTAFDTAPYGNIYISPSQMFHLKPYEHEKTLNGWLILHNPSHDKIGYQVLGLEFDEEDNKATIGCLDPGQSCPLYLKTKMKITDSSPVEMIVKWIAMEKAKTYTNADVRQKFQSEDFANRIFEHKLNVVIQETIDSTKVVQKITDGVPAEKDVYCLQIFVNGTQEGSYWLKNGNYRFDIPYPEGEYIVKYPRAPSYHYPDKVDRGMTVILLEPGGKYYTLAVVTEVKGDGAYTVSYLDQETKLMTLSLTGQDDCNFGMEIEDWKKDVTRYRLHTTTLRVLNRTQVPVPSYLLKEGSRLALAGISPDWKSSALETFSNCNQVLTRVTVQEQDIVTLSRQLTQWTSKIAKDRNFAFLPLKMNLETLQYPDPVRTFTDIAVHTVCYLSRQNMKYKPPVHFVDAPGVPLKPDHELPLELSFGSKHTGWVYVSLLRCKMKLPSYTKLIETTDESYNREKIEVIMIKLIQMYASMCSLFAAQYGGLSQQQTLGKGGNELILSALSKPDTVIELDGRRLPRDTGTGDELYYSTIGVTVCMDHLLSFADNFADEHLPTFNLRKYSEVIHVFCWESMRIDRLPDNFFETLRSVQIFVMEDCQIAQSSLPSGAAKCTELSVLSLNNVSITQLPDDLLDITVLQFVTLKKLPVKQLNIRFPFSQRLTILEMSSLLIEEVPVEVCNVKSLQKLTLSQNPISNLPPELETLTNLKVLEVDGIPWINLGGKTKTMTREDFNDWCENKTNIKNYLTENRVKALFEEYKKEKSNVLNEKGIAALNLRLLFEIPRIGTKQFRYLDLFPTAWYKITRGYNLINKSYFGGIPPVVFKLKSLVTLSLKYQGITKVPSEIGKLQNLRELKLDNCPLLESISGSAGVIPNIKDISLIGCPSLSTPPEEVVRNGFKSVKAFLKEIAGGQVLCPRTKLMFVGLGGAGKTSLLKSLMSSDKKRNGKDEPFLTDGIDICDWKVTTNDGEQNVTFHTWDFAGQTVYYHTHQFFLSNRAVYLLLWNMRMGFEHAGLDFWLNSIMCHAPDAPILVIGTHLDQVTIPELPERYLRSQYKQIHGFYYVSAVDGTNLKELEKDLVSVALEQPYMKQEIPKVWIDLEERIKLERSKCDYLEWSTITKFAEDNGIYDEKIKLALQFLGDLGTIQYFDSEVLNKRIVIKPQWIVDVMAKLVSVKNTLIVENKGRFNHSDLTKVWDGFDDDVCKWLLSMTEEFDLTFRAPVADDKDPPCNIVPCLVPDDDEPDEQNLENVLSKRGIIEIQILYRFNYLPIGLFNRAQVRLFQFAKETRIWKRGSILHKGNHTILIQQTRGTADVSIIVQGPRPENTLLNVHEVFESLVDETYHGVTYDLFIPCPECLIEEGMKNCVLFEDSLIRAAKSKKNVYFLQCRGGFHEIPLGYLHTALPEATSSDFYARLQQSINSLQEINSNMARDVVILYSQENVSTEDNADKVNPVWIRNDLIKNGISCWFEDMEVSGVQYMRALVKSCKVVVICMSDEFASDRICNDVFNYASDINIPICAAVITESKEWENSNIKFRLGNPMMAMLRNKQKYTKNIYVLIEMVQNQLQEREEAVEASKQCFISYCWKNSKEAVKKGTLSQKSSLGQDPRQIKRYLEDNKISCWLDENEIGQEDQLYKDIAGGILNCKVVVLCVSKEYVESENCMMEARFVVQLRKPFVIAHVGKGSTWIESETGLILQKVPNFEIIDFENDRTHGLERLLNLVKEYIAESEKKLELTRKTSMGNYDAQTEDKMITAGKKDGNKSILKTEKSEEDEDILDQSIISEHNSLSFKEEVELIQRKFMRHFTQTAKAKYQNTPRLLVFDFIESDSKSNAKKDSKEGSTEIIGDNKVMKQMDSVDGPQVASTNSRKKRLGRHESKMDIIRQSEPERDDSDWRKEQFCIRMLCEHEGGWHLVSNPLSLKTRSFEEIEKYLETTSPFLIYLYIILKFSSVPLLCFNGQKGEDFQNWMFEKTKHKLGDRFLEAFDSLRAIVLEHEDEEAFIGQLQKCHLPTGRNMWLCGSDDLSHQNGERITKLGIGTTGKGITTLYREDILMNEYLQKTIGPGTLEFASRHYNVSWKAGWSKIKLLRLNGAGGNIKSSFRLLLKQRNKIPKLIKQVEVEFQHGEKEKSLDIWIGFPEVTQDTGLSVELSDTGNARLGETRKTVIHIKYDGDSGTFEFPSNTYVLQLSAGYKLKIPVNRQQGSDSIVKLNWRAKDISATCDDYGPTGGCIEFAEKVTEQFICIEVKKDHTIAYKESVTFELELCQHVLTHSEIGRSYSTMVTIYNDCEQHNRKKEKKPPSKTLAGEVQTATSLDAAKQSIEKADTTTKSTRPKLKTVVTTAMITNAAMNATKNKSRACCLQ